MGENQGGRSFGASDNGEGRTFVGTRRSASEGSLGGGAKGSQMGLSDRRSNFTATNLLARNAVTEREAGLRGHTLEATISERLASATEDIGTKSTRTGTRRATFDDDWWLRRRDRVGGSGLSGREGHS